MKPLEQVDDGRTDGRRAGTHWVYRPQNRVRLRLAGALVLAGALLAQVWFAVHGHFGFDGWFGFSALYGFLSCAALVLLANLLGWAVKRPDDYHDER